MGLLMIDLEILPEVVAEVMMSPKYVIIKVDGEEEVIEYIPRGRVPLLEETQ